MRKIQFASYSLLLFLIFSNCQKDSEVKVYENVDPELWEYFERFETEAAVRGHEVDLAGGLVSGSIARISGEHVAGQCTYNPSDPNHVLIDEEFWLAAGDFLKEFIIFHELGHCKLLREHRGDAFDNGDCKSIMRSGLEGCRDNYNSVYRPQYLDELFDPDKF